MPRHEPGCICAVCSVLRAMDISTEKLLSTDPQEGTTMYGTHPKEDEDLSGRYIVWSPESSVPPKLIYASRPDAIKATFGMAKKFPTQRFAVCKIVGESKSRSVEYTSFED